VAPGRNVVESERGSVVPFFLLTLAVTWGLQVPAVLVQEGVLPGDAAVYMPLAMLGIFGPLLAAVILTARREGRAGLRALFRPLLTFRVPARWYVAGIVLPAAGLSAILFLLSLAGYRGDVVLFPGADRLAVIPVIAIAEEVGWRGYALPRLQQRHGPFVASVVIGVVWAVWHIPMFLGAGIPMSLMLMMTFHLVAGSVVFTWIFNRSGGSLLLVVLAHGAIHLNNPHLPLPQDLVPSIASAITFAAIALAAVYFDHGAFPLARGGRLTREAAPR
jgi:membrane protease YdiL (CAAX protease family)